MLLFIFAGFIFGFALSLFFVRRPKAALIWGLVLGCVPLFLMLGPGNAPVQGIGSVLNFAFFALGPLMLIPFVASSAALGVAGGAAVLWAAQGRARWVGWVTGVTLVGVAATLTLLPVAKREIAKRQADADRNIRTAAIMRADFKGTLAGHQISFPASPLLHVLHDCASGVQPGSKGCRTSLNNPVTTFTKPDEVLLHERSDPISFDLISISAVEADCSLGEYCLTQEKIDRWCHETRPDLTDSIWCRDIPPMQFRLATIVRAAETTSPSARDEPELAAGYADTPLGSGQVRCFYAPDPNDTDRQGSGCTLTFTLADGIKASLGARRAQIISGDPLLLQTIALIPDYWSELTSTR